ncbi:hypothetical protein KTQ42_20290 [Noviherbaspirillum sp. L7-7A]|uniref:hypothetical protein n=1 Tax=Noviherbaspirillum sp. L7-7A TaxID=2850560 RepID=UPI001C2C76F9|nr:hypothetical protein [Noviherbaspirillum sp. L7-7A]MBV0881624.1 hypothetical protein [Noviherbaspirillum sp. L7-7A]
MNAADISTLFEEGTTEKATIQPSAALAAWPGISTFLMSADPKQSISAKDFMKSSAVSVATEFAAVGLGFNDDDKSANAYHHCWTVSMKAGGVVYFLFHDHPILRDAVSKIADPGPVSHFIGTAYFVPLEHAFFLKAFDVYLRNMLVLPGLSSFNEMLVNMSCMAKALLEKLPETQRDYFVDKFRASLTNGLPATEPLPAA